MVTYVCCPSVAAVESDLLRMRRKSGHKKCK